MHVLKSLFEQHFGVGAEGVQSLHGTLGASGRRIFRISSPSHTAIGILYDCREENAAFIEFSRHFRKHGLPVPEIYAADLEHGAYLEEDLGDTTLFQFLANHRSHDKVAPQVVDAYRKAIAFLPRFQVEAGRDLNYAVSYPRASFDRQAIAWDLNYFKYYFLRPAGIGFSEQRLEEDFGRLSDFLLGADCDYFLYRDFQSRNIMLLGGGPYFLDYQGGRKGALQYDIASLLFDAKADLPPALRQQLLEHYLEQLAGFITFDRDAFMRHYYAYAYVRIMQALGAYGFRGLYEGKPLFVQSIPYALKNVRWLLANVELPLALPALRNAFQQMVDSEKLRAIASESDRLTVRIMSFSFHRGLPRDDAGHGGGFVFDARSLPNPGREERFRSLTGKDAPVIHYLEREESVREYQDNVLSLVAAAVENYQRRGFKSLSIAFGCTGGQHRSVYLAEHLARQLRVRDGLSIIVRHRELESLSPCEP